MAKPSKADRVRETLDAVVQCFAQGDVPAAVARVTFPCPDVPMAKWSLSNRFLAAIRGTADARGYRQWQQAGRQVKKGARAFYILGPRMVKVKEKDRAGNETEGMRLAGFIAIPVFRVEDTEGDPLPYASIKVPDVPLLDVARRWGVDVRAVGFTGKAYGWANTNGREIVLASPDEAVFFHELSHVADGRLNGALKGGQHPDQEIVAELSAAVLARLVGRSLPNDGEHYQYIRSYASRWFPKASPADAIRKACHRILTRACKVVESILTETETAGQPAAA